MYFLKFVLTKSFLQTIKKFLEYISLMLSVTNHFHIGFQMPHKFWILYVWYADYQHPDYW